MSHKEDHVLATYYVSCEWSKWGENAWNHITVLYESYKQKNSFMNGLKRSRFAK